MLLAAPSTGLQLLPQGVVISGLPRLEITDLRPATSRDVISGLPRLEIISRSAAPPRSSAISGSEVIFLLPLLLLGERAERAEG